MINIDNTDYGFRKIEKIDLELLLNWRNSERIHKVMLTDHLITMEEHEKWFENISQYNPLRNFIFTYKGKPIGYFGYTQYDSENMTCSPGSYIGEESSDIPVDAGLALAYCVNEYAFVELKMKTLISEVLDNNKRVLHLDKLLGYQVVGEVYIKKGEKHIKSYKISLNKEEWEVNKNKIISCIK